MAPVISSEMLFSALAEGFIFVLPYLALTIVIGVIFTKIKNYISRR